MRIYAVIAYCTYYPSPDNVLKVFSRYASAERYMKDIKASGDIYAEHFEIITYKVEED